MKFTKLLLLAATVALKYTNSKTVVYDSFNYNFHCSSDDTLCDTIKTELTDAVYSLSTLLNLSPPIQFDAIVDDISKYRNNTKKDTYATTVDNLFVPLDSKDTIIKSPYPNASNLISKFDSSNKFSNADFILLLNTFDSDPDFLINANYDYKNNAIKEIFKGLQSLDKLEAPYNNTYSNPPPPPPKDFNGNLPPPPSSKPPKSGSNRLPPPDSMNLSICDRVERNQNNTALMIDASVNDKVCQETRLNKLSSIINWKNKLISKGDPSETSDYKYKRLVAVGDIHGDVQKLQAIMRHAGLINNRDQWIAEDTIFVQTGDLVDRGNDIKEILDLLKKLMKPASKSNCLMYLLLGNHEIMNLQGEYQFTSRGDVRSFKSIDRRENVFSPTGKYGKILRGEMNVTIATNDSIFVHAGLTPEYAQLGIDTMNQRVREILTTTPSFPELCELSKKNITHPLFTEQIINDHSNGPLMTRSFANGDESEICSILEKTLEITKTKRMVVGHTVQDYGEIKTKCNNKLIMIDLGMSDCYGNYFGYLEILNDKNEVWAVYNN